MDVGCPKCQTEYELDDARVPEDGVTVKCTTCNHVFRVKKKSLVVTLPVRDGDAAQRAQPASELPPAPPSREWKIRQPGGNVFTCRELTTLQKWIIEGKVGRDDEISLSGDTWKRLGNIPELASFFQVFEDAKKARALDALSAVPPPSPSSPTAPGAGPSITDTWREPQFTAPPPQPVPPRAEPVASGPPSIRETIREPQFSVPPPAPVPVQPTPAPQPAPVSRPSQQLPMAPAMFRDGPGPSDEDLERAVKGGGRGTWIALILVGLGLGGGAAWYFGIYAPEQARLEAERNRPPEPTPTVVVPTPQPAVVDPGVVELDAGVAVDAGAVAVPEVVDAGAPEVDAGTPEVDAGTPDAGKPEPKRTYEYFMAQGDRLRDREKPEQALDMYGQAADLKPNRAEPIAGRGLALLDMGNNLAAQAAFEQALALNSRYGPAIMGMAEAYRLQGKNEKAIEFYQRYLDVLPNGAEAAVARNNIERLKK